MRTTTVFLLFLSYFVVHSQEVSKNIHIISEEEVPFEVLNIQRDLFPFIRVSEWQVQKKDRGADSPSLRFISRIVKDGNSYLSASYLPNGLLLFTSEIISPTTVPENIRLDVKRNHPRFKMQAADLITLTAPKKEIYWIKLLDGNLLQYVFYDTSGQEIARKDLPHELTMIF